MKTLQKIILFTLISAVFITCKKEVLTPTTTIEGQPVFSFSGTIGGNNLNLQAGVNNYYMYSSYTDTNGVYNFTGLLKSTANNFNSIQITINDDTLKTPGSKSDISKSVTPATYYFNIPGGNPINYSVTFTPIIYSGTPLSFKYIFGDGITTTYPSDSAITHIYKILQNYPTSLNVHFTNGNVTMNNPVDVLKQVNPLKINNITSTPPKDSAGRDSVSFTATIQGGAPTYTYLWNFGDTKTTSITSTNTTVTVYHTYSDPNHTHNTFPVTLNVTDGNASSNYNYTVADTTGDSSICRMDYSVSTPTPVPNLKALSNVTVVYTDGTGKVYTSNNASQPIQNNLVITSVSDYQNNINNNRTKMLKITFSCTLYPVLGGTAITANNCTAVIAVAYN